VWAHLDSLSPKGTCVITDLIRKEVKKGGEGKRRRTFM
jgi:hypothetical protein